MQGNGGANSGTYEVCGHRPISQSLFADGQSTVPLGSGQSRLTYGVAKPLRMLRK